MSDVPRDLQPSAEMKLAAFRSIGAIEMLRRLDVPSAVERIRALQDTLCHMRDEINRLDNALGSLCLTLDPPPAGEST